jgi:hypothetical protein
MLIYLLIAAVAYVAGAFSHKWAAAAFKDTTGLDAQAVADQAKQSAANVVGKAESSVKG